MFNSSTLEVKVCNLGMKFFFVKLGVTFIMSIDIFLNLRVLGDYYHIPFTAINQTGKNFQNRKFDFHFWIWNFHLFLDFQGFLSSDILTPDYSL